MEFDTLYGKLKGHHCLARQKLFSLKDFYDKNIKEKDNG